MGGRTRPDPRALEGRRDLDHKTLPYPKLHFAGVSHHLDEIPVDALVTGLGHQGLEAGTDLPGGQIATRCDELHPQGHRSLPAIAEFQDSTARQGAIVHEVEDAHLVEVEDYLELVGGYHLHALKSVNINYILISLIILFINFYG